nr:hypothetical protein KPHV_87160 [Kitasatospora purpeofusca]
MQRRVGGDLGDDQVGGGDRLSGRDRAGDGQDLDTVTRLVHETPAAERTDDGHGDTDSDQSRAAAASRGRLGDRHGGRRRVGRRSRVLGSAAGHRVPHEWVNNGVNGQCQRLTVCSSAIAAVVDDARVVVIVPP